MFGFGGLQSKAGLEAIKKGLGETNPAVRTASIGLLGWCLLIKDLYFIMKIL